VEPRYRVDGKGDIEMDSIGQAKRQKTREDLGNFWFRLP
jgi:hypothetical protein